MFLVISNTLWAQSGSVDGRPGIKISSDVHAYSIWVRCASVDCSRLEIKYGTPEGIISVKPKSQFPLNVSLSEVYEFVKKVNIPRSYMLSDIKYLKYDPAAGALNMFLPIIWFLAGTVSLPLDAIEALTPQNKSLLKAVENLREKLLEANELGTLENVRMDGIFASKTFIKMVDLVENAAVAQQKRACLRSY